MDEETLPPDEDPPTEAGRSDGGRHPDAPDDREAAGQTDHDVDSILAFEVLRHLYREHLLPGDPAFDRRALELADGRDSVCRRVFALIEQAHRTVADIPLPSLEGRTVNDCYQLEQSVACGGYSVVYAANHLRTAVPCVVKATPMERLFGLPGPPVAAYQHACVLRIEDQFTDSIDGIAVQFEVYRQAEGLRCVLAEPNGVWSRRDRVLFMRDVADAVAHFHTLGFVHRDLKPDNIVVERDGGLRPRIIDLQTMASFEMAAAFAEDWRGTYPYMPRHLPKCSHPAAADVYALGLTMIEVLTPSGQAAVAALSTSESDGAAALSRAIAELSAELRAIVTKAMGRDGQPLYEDARGLRDDLQRVLDHRPLPSTALPRRGMLLLRRHRLASTAIAVLAVIVALLALQLRTARLSEQQAIDASNAFAELLLQVLDPYNGPLQGNEDLLERATLIATEAERIAEAQPARASAYLRVSGRIAANAGAPREATARLHRSIELHDTVGLPETSHLAAALNWQAWAITEWVESDDQPPPAERVAELRAEAVACATRAAQIASACEGPRSDNALCLRLDVPRMLFAQGSEQEGAKQLLEVLADAMGAKPSAAAGVIVVGQFARAASEAAGLWPRDREKAKQRVRSAMAPLLDRRRPRLAGRMPWSLAQLASAVGGGREPAGMGKFVAGWLLMGVDRGALGDLLMATAADLGRELLPGQHLDQRRIADLAAALHGSEVASATPGSADGGSGGEGNAVVGP